MNRKGMVWGRMTYWNDKVADATQLRLFVPGDGWRAFKDKMNAEGDRVEDGVYACSLRDALAAKGLSEWATRFANFSGDPEGGGSL